MSHENSPEQYVPRNAEGVELDYSAEAAAYDAELTQRAFTEALSPHVAEQDRIRDGIVEQEYADSMELAQLLGTPEELMTESDLAREAELDSQLPYEMKELAGTAADIMSVRDKSETPLKADLARLQSQRDRTRRLDPSADVTEVSKAIKTAKKQLKRLDKAEQVQLAEARNQLKESAQRSQPEYTIDPFDFWQAEAKAPTPAIAPVAPQPKPADVEEPQFFFEPAVPVDAPRKRDPIEVDPVPPLKFSDIIPEGADEGFEEFDMDDDPDFMNWSASHIDDDHDELPEPSADEQFPEDAKDEPVLPKGDDVLVVEQPNDTQEDADQLDVLDAYEPLNFDELIEKYDTGRADFVAPGEVDQSEPSDYDAAEAPGLDIDDDHDELPEPSADEQFPDDEYEYDHISDVESDGDEPEAPDEPGDPANIDSEDEWDVPEFLRNRVIDGSDEPSDVLDVDDLEPAEHENPDDQVQAAEGDLSGESKEQAVEQAMKNLEDGFENAWRNQDSSDVDKYRSSPEFQAVLTAAGEAIARLEDADEQSRQRSILTRKIAEFTAGLFSELSDDSDEDPVVPAPARQAPVERSSQPERTPLTRGQRVLGRMGLRGGLGFRSRQR